MSTSAEQPAPDEEAPFRYFYTDAFPPLLEACHATLLVSTYQAGKLCVFRSEGGRLTMLPRTFDKAMGIAATTHRMAIATRYQVWYLHNEPILAPKIKPHDQHDACYIPRRCHVTGNIDAHETAWGQDELWIVNTQFSCLCTLDLRYSFVPRWKPPFVSAFVRQDRCHLNGLAMQGAHPAYVTAFAESDVAEGWRQHKDNAGLVVHVASGETVASGLSMPHSPRLHAGKLWVLDSGRGALAMVDVKSGHVETVATLSGYTRGLAFHDRFAFVGLSKIRETAIFGSVPIADESIQRQCGVAVIDIHSGQIVAQLHFESTVQEIFDIQILPQIRFPAVIGFDKETIQRATVIGPPQLIANEND